MKKRGFTDKLYFLNLALSWLFIIVCIILTALSGRLGITDLSLVSVGIPAVFAELGVHTGFIVWKAKTENMSKFGNQSDYINETEHEPEQIVQAIGFQTYPEEENDEREIIE